MATRVNGRSNTETSKNGLILAASFLVGILILITYLVISTQYGDAIRAQENRFDKWLIQNIPIRVEFVLSLATSVTAIAISFFPMRLRTFFIGVIGMLLLMTISMPALTKLPDPWGDLLYLLTLFSIGIAIISLRLEFAPAMRAWRKSKGLDPDEFRLI